MKSPTKSLGSPEKERLLITCNSDESWLVLPVVVLERTIWWTDEKKGTLGWNQWHDYMSWSLILPHCPACCLSLERRWKSHPESELLCGRRRRKNRDKRGHKESPNSEKKAIHWHEKEQTSCWLIKRALSSCTVCVCVCVFPCGCFTSNGAFQLLSPFFWQMNSILHPFRGRSLLFGTKRKMCDVN